MAAGWRKVDVVTGDGEPDHDPGYEYQFGAEVDGVFVPAVTKSAGYIDALVQRAKDAEPKKNG